MTKAIGFDPGLTTGYAIGEFDEAFSDTPLIVVTGEVKWEHSALWQFLQEQKPDFIIYERFDSRHTRHRQGVELYSRELIGVLQLYAQIVHRYHYCELVAQGAMKGGVSPKLGAPTAYFNDNRLKTAGIYKTGKGHSNDAARHLLTWWWNGSGGQFDSRKRGYKSGVLL